MAVRGKFRLSSKRRHYWNQVAEEFAFDAVCNDGTPENERYHKYTPSGTIIMVVDNPVAQEQFELGKNYYVDFSPAD